tara:strand:- start:229 stop:456 length:228 start_codon:yes stop_codon:yes gene_type:complete
MQKGEGKSEDLSSSQRQSAKTEHGHQEEQRRDSGVVVVLWDQKEKLPPHLLQAITKIEKVRAGELPESENCSQQS